MPPTAPKPRTPAQVLAEMLKDSDLDDVERTLSLILEAEKGK